MYIPTCVVEKFYILTGHLVNVTSVKNKYSCILPKLIFPLCRWGEDLFLPVFISPILKFLIFIWGYFSSCMYFYEIDIPYVSETIFFFLYFPETDILYVSVRNIFPLVSKRNYSWLMTRRHRRHRRHMTCEEYYVSKSKHMSFYVCLKEIH